MPTTADATTDMPLVRFGSRLLFFAHIPKTGGSSVEAYMAQKGAMALKFGRRLGWSKSTVQHMQAELHTRLIPDDFIDASFAVLRDPVDRLVSEYRYRVDRNANQPPFARWVERAFERYARDPYAFDNHIRPQAAFIRPGMTLFRFEAGLSPVFDWIDRMTDGEASDRQIWSKRSKSAAVDVPEDIRSQITAFYADDVALIDRMGDASHAQPFVIP